MATARTTLDPVDTPIDTDLLNRRVEGYGIADESTLGSELFAAAGQDGMSLLVFLRHFG